MLAPTIPPQSAHSDRPATATAQDKLSSFRGDEMEDVGGIVGAALAAASSTTPNDSDFTVQLDAEATLAKLHPRETRTTPATDGSGLDTLPQPDLLPVAKHSENHVSSNTHAPQSPVPGVISLTPNEGGFRPSTDTHVTPAEDVNSEASRAGLTANTNDTSLVSRTVARSLSENTADNKGATVIEVASTQAELAGNTQRRFDSTPKQFDDYRATAVEQVDSFAAMERNVAAAARNSAGTEPNTHMAAGSVRAQLVKAITLGSSRDAAGENARIELELDPPELGRVWVRLTSNGSGVTAHMRASNEAAVAMIEAQMTSLLESLQSKGMTIDDVHVEHQADFFGPDQNQSSDRNWEQEMDPHQRSAHINPSREQLPARLPPLPGDGMVDILV